MGLFVDKLITNPNNIIMINNNHHRIVGFISSDFGFNVSSGYEDLFSQKGAFNDIAAKAGALLSSKAFQRIAGNISEALAGNAIPGVGKKVTGAFAELGQKINAMQNFDRSLTRSIYQGTQKPNLTVPLIFMATKPTDEPMTELRKLLTLTSNSISSTGIVESNQSKKTSRQGEAGTCFLNIGTWFRATKLVPLSVEFTCSKEHMRNGSPVLIIASVTFETFTVPTEKELDGWFLKGKRPVPDTSLTSPSPRSGLSTKFPINVGS